nr:hypothetical protein [Tanacetum cinerariifolium]
MKGYKLPPSYNEIKKTFKMIGLGYESIHACVNDCFLFQGDNNKDMHFCPMCKTSRWKDSNTPGKKVPKKSGQRYKACPTCNEDTPYQICPATLMEDDMLKAQSKVLDILCNLELIYALAFFDIMIHLVIYLPLDALEGGPIRHRWMFPFERFMKKLIDIIDLDEDDDIINDEDALPYDLADSNDEDLLNVDDDDDGADAVYSSQEED